MIKSFGVAVNPTDIIEFINKKDPYYVTIPVPNISTSATSPSTSACTSTCYLTCRSTSYSVEINPFLHYNTLPNEIMITPQKISEESIQLIYATEPCVIIVFPESSSFLTMNIDKIKKQTLLHTFVSFKKDSSCDSSCFIYLEKYVPVDVFLEHLLPYYQSDKEILQQEYQEYMQYFEYHMLKPKINRFETSLVRSVKLHLSGFIFKFKIPFTGTIVTNYHYRDDFEYSVDSIITKVNNETSIVTRKSDLTKYNWWVCADVYDEAKLHILHVALVKIPDVDKSDYQKYTKIAIIQPEESYSEL